MSYMMTSDHGVVVGGWTKVGGGGAWLLKLDSQGKQVWEKRIPANEGKMISLAPAIDGNGFWGIICETQAKRKVRLTARWFDNNGIELHQYTLVNEEGSDISLSEDVTLFPDGRGLYVFGGSTRNELVGYLFAPAAEDKSLMQATYSNVLEYTGFYNRLTGFAHFVTIRNPSGGFYSAYTATTAEGQAKDSEDYRLMSVDTALNIRWSVDFGGDLTDGLSSLALDNQGNPTLAGFSYSGVSRDKSEPALEKDHCDVWVVKADKEGRKIWDKTINGPDCILNAKLAYRGDKLVVIFKEETSMQSALIEEQ